MRYKWRRGLVFLIGDKMKKRSNRIKIVFLLFVVMLFIILGINLNKSTNVKKNKKGEIAFQVAGINVTATDELIGEANRPQLGAGMIPIKYNNGIWEITSESNENNNWWLQ